MTSFHRNRWIALLVCAMLAGFSVGASLGWRYYEGRATVKHVDQLCLVLRGLVKDGDKALPSIAYYQTHPTDLAAAHQRNQDALRRLACGNLTR